MVDKPTLKIGYLDSLAGRASDYEKDAQAGVEATIDEIKQEGGIPEWRIEALQGITS